MTSVVCSVVCSASSDASSISSSPTFYHHAVFSAGCYSSFLVADSAILDDLLTGEMQLLKLVATMTCVHSLDGGMEQHQISSFAQCVVTSQIV